MRIIKDTFARVNGVIQSDKEVITDGCKSLVIKDVAANLSEYFELKGLPTMDVVYEDGIYRVTVSFEADRIKKFNVLR